jgi:Leucine-rich repeat (LRR) protein
LLTCSNNQLTKLDVSKNTELTILDCRNNQFQSASLNALFKTLNGNKDDKVIDIDNNPGADACNRKIAEDRGWEWKIK